MNKYKITTDNTADLPYSYYREHDIEYMYLTYQLEGINYGKNNELNCKEFYDKMRNGSMPTTSQVNSEEAKEVLRPFLEEGFDILHLAFSSGLVEVITAFGWQQRNYRKNFRREKSL